MVQKAKDYLKIGEDSVKYGFDEELCDYSIGKLLIKNERIIHITDTICKFLSR